MNISSTMQFLADNYVAGIAVLSVLVISLYLVFSIRLVITSHKEGINIALLGMIPVINIILWVRKCVVKQINKTLLSEDEEIEL